MKLQLKKIKSAKKIILNKSLHPQESKARIYLIKKAAPIFKMHLKCI